MRFLHINNSYNIWRPSRMIELIKDEANKKYNAAYPELLLNRNYFSMIIEWWLHNIGYYVTKPFCFIAAIDKINLRCKHVDLEER